MSSQTKTLIGGAVFNSASRGLRALSDRLFAFWFNRLVYAQIWEDPEVDLQALKLRPGEEMLTISSGGCNALAYLTQPLGALHAVDLNATHLATLDLKRAALGHLPAYTDVLGFLGDANHASNVQHYHALAPHLQPESRRLRLPLESGVLSS